MKSGWAGPSLQHRARPPVGAAHRWAQTDEESGKQGFPGGPSTLTGSLPGRTLATTVLESWERRQPAGGPSTSQAAVSGLCGGGGGGSWEVQGADRGWGGTLPSPPLPTPRPSHTALVRGPRSSLPRASSQRPSTEGGEAPTWGSHCPGGAPRPPLAWALLSSSPLSLASLGWVQGGQKDNRKEGLDWDSESAHRHVSQQTRQMNLELPEGPGG